MARVLFEIKGDIERVDYISSELSKCLPEDVECHYAQIKCVCCGNVSAEMVEGFPLCEEHKSMVSDLVRVANGEVKLVEKK